jgi:uncharacterized protein YjiS (DUF1127 family)
MMKGRKMQAHVASIKLSRPAPTQRSLLARLLAWRDEARQKARLRLLDDHLLSDIGVSRAEAEAESERPVWDSPSHWRG